jgi:NADPH2:quinone reductase
MAKMKAVLSNPQSTDKLEMGEVDEPLPLPSQALVRVAAFSLNRGEVRSAMATDKRYVIGWDLAGTVEKAAADGSGPKTGSRVVGLLPTGAWAELAAVPTANLTELPQGVTFKQAATLPVAGLTALYSVQRGGSLLAHNVLVTGASGGVGVFAVQLAHLSGANVTGLTNHVEYEGIVRKLGAANVVVGSDASGAAAYGPYHLIVEGVGGPVLASVFGLLAPGGVLINFGSPPGVDVTFNPRILFAAPRAAYSGFLLFNEVKYEPASLGLKRLADLVAFGRLDTCIEVEADWEQVAEMARRLMDRKFAGKAVLMVT